MTIKPVLVYRNADSTADLNSRAARVIDRGIFDGGHVSPSGAALSLTIAPFVAVGWDGMVAVSDATETLTFTAPGAGTTISYVILHLEYRSLTSSIANLQVVPESTWTSSVSNEFFITFCRVEVPAGATSLQDPGVVIDYSEGDWAEKAGKAGWRAPVANAAALPTISAGGPNLGNRDGDVRLALDTYQLYAWDASSETWGAVGGAVGLSDLNSRKDVFDNQLLRSFNGTGLVGTTNNDGTGRSSNVVDAVDWEIVNTVANRIDIAPLHAVVNGHFVKTAYTELTLTAPAAGRYDLVYLEVWRETIADVTAETYPNDPTVGGTSTFAQLVAHFETLLEQRTSPNMGIADVEAIDASTILATRWRITSVANVSTSSINDTLLAASTATNIDANTFSISGTQNDQRAWQAVAASAYDGVSWAIPLVIIRRTLSEAGPSSYILETRPDDEDNRYVYDVAPRATLGLGIAAIGDGASSGATSGLKNVYNASGFTRGMSDPITGASGSISIPASTFRIRGAEIVNNNPVVVPLPVAPGAGARRDLVVIEAERTIHPHGVTGFVGLSEVEVYDRQGLRAPRWTARARVFDVGTDLDTPDAMVTAGYTSSDLGLWERAPLDSEDSRLGVVLAIPVALIHRRNTGAFSVPGNPNGSTGRPDGISDSEFPAEKEILDLRHRAVESEGEVAAIMRESMDKLMRGELRTRMRAAPYLSNVAGIQTLQNDQIGSLISFGRLNVTPFTEGSTTVWGDSDEAVLLSAVFPVWNSGGAVNDGSTYNTFQWNGSATQGFLTINAPPGYVLNVDHTRTNEGLGPGGILIGTATTGTDTATDIFRAATFAAASVTTDAAGNVTQLGSGATPIPLPAGASNTGKVFVAIWARRPHRDLNAAYSSNGGLFEVPDKVHRIDFFDGVSTREIDQAPIVVQYTDTPSGDQIVITQSDLFTALGGGGNRYATASSDLRMYGILEVLIEDSTSVLGTGLPKVRYVNLTDSAGTGPGFERMVVEFSPGSVAVPVTLTIAFDGDLINRWAIVTPLNRGVRGLYSWHATAITTSGSGVQSGAAVLPTRGALPLPQRSYMVPMKDGGYEGTFLGTRVGNGLETAVGYPDFLDNDSSNDTNEVIFYAMNPDRANTSWRLWTDPDDRDELTIGPEFGVPNTSFQYSVVEAAKDTYNCSSYSPIATAGYDFYWGEDTHYLVVSPCRVPLLGTQALNLYYDMTPYQGLADVYPLQDKTTGRVLEVSDTTVHTMGTNLPWISPRALSRVYDGSVFEGSDVGSKFSQGQDLAALRRLHLGTSASSSLATLNEARPRKPMAALTRRLPFTGAETSLVNNVLSTLQPLTQRVVIHPEEASGENFGGVFIGMDYDVGKWLALSSPEFVHYPLRLPLGANLNSIDLFLGVSGGPSSNFSVSILRLTTAVPSSEFPDSVSVTTDRDLVRYLSIEGADLYVDENIVLRISNSTGGVSAFVYDVHAYYTTPGADYLFNRFDRYKVFPYRGGGYSPALHKGAILENPWDPGEFSALEALYFSDASDTYGSVPRGKAASFPVDLGLFTTAVSGGGFFYYVPLSNIDFTNTTGENLATWLDKISWPFPSSPRADSLPQAFSPEIYEVYGGQSPDPFSLSTLLYTSAAFGYIIKNDDGALSLVAGQSANGIAVPQRESTYLVSRGGGGTAIDAFYPVGRPVYIKED